MAKQEKAVTGEQAAKWVQQNVGFWLHFSQAEQRAYVAELGTGKIIRPATEEDIAKWNKAWNKVMGKLYAHNEKQKSRVL